MKTFSWLLLLTGLSFFSPPKDQPKIFDVHIHGHPDWESQLNVLAAAGVYKAAISTSWDLQNRYRDKTSLKLLYGLMLPCPEGKVPYSLQPCFSDGKDWPPLEWVEAQIKAKKIDFLGEVLSQYYGISSSDSLLLPYYALAAKYNLPVGIHTGGAGPNHGSRAFKMELGNPSLMEKMLIRFPTLKVWIMHSGDQFSKETIAIMQKYKHVYADISVISNPAIVPPSRFDSLLKTFLKAGLEDRLMFGSDNGDIAQVVAALNNLTYLSQKQKEKIFYKNAEQFFALK